MERDEEERGEAWAVGAAGDAERERRVKILGGARTNREPRRRGRGRVAGPPARPAPAPAATLSPTMTLIRLEGGTGGFNDRTLFEGVDFELADGERVRLVGRTGRGVLLLKILGRVEPPTRGR